MNKFFFKVTKIYHCTLKQPATEHIVVCKYGRTVDGVEYKVMMHPYYLDIARNSELFYSMCKEPVKALLYLKHEEYDVQALAKMILLCKEPVEVMYCE